MSLTQWLTSRAPDRVVDPRGEGDLQLRPDPVRACDEDGLFVASGDLEEPPKDPGPTSVSGVFVSFRKPLMRASATSWASMSTAAVAIGEVRASRSRTFYLVGRACASSARVWGPVRTARPVPAFRRPAWGRLGAGLWACCGRVAGDRLSGGKKKTMDARLSAGCPAGVKTSRACAARAARRQRATRSSRIRFPEPRPCPRVHILGKEDDISMSPIDGSRGS
jgi:hypothetical protein